MDDKCACGRLLETLEADEAKGNVAPEVLARQAGQVLSCAVREECPRRHVNSDRACTLITRILFRGEGP